MTTYKIDMIRQVSEVHGWGQDYIDDCRALATEWDEDSETATFTDAALAEIRETWRETGASAKRSAVNTTRKPCTNCRGL